MLEPLNRCVKSILVKITIVVSAPSLYFLDLFIVPYNWTWQLSWWSLIYLGHLLRRWKITEDRRLQLLESPIWFKHRACYSVFHTLEPRSIQLIPIQKIHALFMYYPQQATSNFETSWSIFVVTQLASLHLYNEATSRLRAAGPKHFGHNGAVIWIFILVRHQISGEISCTDWYTFTTHLSHSLKQIGALLCREDCECASVQTAIATVKIADHRLEMATPQPSIQDALPLQQFYDDAS